MLSSFLSSNLQARHSTVGTSNRGHAKRRYVLADATQHSLVLVDELGKGTEVNAGAALAGAILEALDGVGCKVGRPCCAQRWQSSMRPL